MNIVNSPSRQIAIADKTVADEERADADHVQDIRVRPIPRPQPLYFLLNSSYEQNKLEAQYAMKLDAAVHDVEDLKQQLELKNQEIRAAHSSLEHLRAANAELEASKRPPCSVHVRAPVSDCRF